MGKPKLEKLSQLEWVELWKDNMTRMSEISHVDYWNTRAEDYDDFINTSEFSYGYEIADILESRSMLNKDMHVVEIAGGVGAVTIPLAQKAKQVISVEPAREMAQRMEVNAAAMRVDNIELKLMTGQEFNEMFEHPTADLSLLCHASWQFPDARELAEMMENASEKWCCICDTVNDLSPEHLALLKKLGSSSGGFDRVFSLYNALCSLAKNPGITFFNYTMRRSEESARSMFTKVLNKERTPTEEDLTLISEFVRTRSENGIYNEPGKMAVIWWSKE